MSNEPTKPIVNPTPTPAASQPDISQLIKDILELKAKQAKTDKVIEASAQPTEAKPKAEIDWTKITEADIANLDIPIPVIEQETPEYLTVHLLDMNFTARWIHILPERLGPCLSSGYNYVTESDLDKRYTHPLSFDVNGHLSHGDVVCLKIHKAKYLGQLKRNYMKTMAIHGRAKSREKLVESIKDDEQLGEALESNSLSMYTPEDMKGKTYTRDIFSAV
jgi:hypothetical protein